jgi:hypothetical protein
LYGTLKLYRPISPFNIMREVPPFVKSYHIIYYYGIFNFGACTKMGNSAHVQKLIGIEIFARFPKTAV